MKQHIGPIYLILGLMAVSTLTIGAGGKPHLEKGEHAARAQAMLPSPMSFRLEASKNGKSERILVISSGDIDAEVEAKVAKALSAAKSQKAG